MVNKKNEESKIRYSCSLCLRNFGNRKDNYQTHLNKTGCGVGISKLEEIIKQNEKNEIDILRLKEENIKLKEENENLKQQVTVNNTNITNIGTVNNYILQINNFNKTSYEGIITNLLKYIGKSIYINTIKDIYLNNEKPENHNIYVADKSRGIVKIWNDGMWQSKNMIVIDQIIDNIVKHFNLSI
jgi:phage-related tail fiber protein